jgi:hypothetical protein
MADGRLIQFRLRNVDREISLREVWMWCSRHCPEKKFKVTTKEREILILRIAEILEVKLDKEQ